jgi:hypothetical protein
MDVEVPAGSEELRCIYGAFPTDRGVTAVSSAESHYTPGSHHVLVYRSDLKSIPDDQTGVWDCSDGSWVMHERGSYYEAQQPDSERVLPEGVAHEFQPGEIVIVQAHYLNTTAQDVAAHVSFKMHTMDPAKVQHEAGSIMFNNFYLDVPPHAKSKATLSCAIPQDIQLALLWSHMHKQGVGFVATTDDAAAAAVLGLLYVEDNWSEPTPREYPNDATAVLHAGSHITFSCEYDNPRDETLVFGNSAAANEMCLLHGMYWPRMPLSAELCFNGKAGDPEEAQ